MMRKKGYFAGYISIIAIALFFAFPVVGAQAATLYFSPSSITRATGQTFSAVIRANTDSQAINAAQGSIIFDPVKIEVTSISKSGSIFSLWTQEPAFSNSEGTVKFEGGVPNPGYSGSSGLILTISFRTKTATTIRGSTTATLVSGAILANDGQGTNILTSLGSLSISISPGADTNVLPGSVEPFNDTPKVESSTHPDITKWYSNNNPAFAWTLPSDVTGVSYLITDKATSNPGPASDGVVSKATFTGISDGTQYFNIKFKQGTAWGPIVHYQFNIDTAPPVGFAIKDVTADPIHPEITFETTDALSGIDHYEVKTDTGEWVSVDKAKAGQAYQIRFDQSGERTVYVKAVDAADNSTETSVLITVPDTGVAASTVGKRIGELFDKLINGLSNNGLLIGLILAIIGFFALGVELIREHTGKTWRNNRGDINPALKAKEAVISKATKQLRSLADDMEGEMVFFESIAKRRKLGSEEKYLKTKIEHYLKQLDKIK